MSINPGKLDVIFSILAVAAIIVFMCFIITNI